MFFVLHALKNIPYIDDSPLMYPPCVPLLYSQQSFRVPTPTQVLEDNVQVTFGCRPAQAVHPTPVPLVVTYHSH
jgi:hypothetical protein